MRNECGDAKRRHRSGNCLLNELTYKDKRNPNIPRLALRKLYKTEKYWFCSMKVGSVVGRGAV